MDEETIHCGRCGVDLGLPVGDDPDLELCPRCGADDDMRAWEAEQRREAEQEAERAAVWERSEKRIATRKAEAEAIRRGEAVTPKPAPQTEEKGPERWKPPAPSPQPASNRLVVELDQQGERLCRMCDQRKTGGEIINFPGKTTGRNRFVCSDCIEVLSTYFTSE